MRRKHSIFTLLSVLPVSSFGYFDGFKTDSSAETPYSAEAKDFLEYLFQAENQKKYAESLGSPSAFTDVDADWAPAAVVEGVNSAIESAANIGYTNEKPAGFSGDDAGRMVQDLLAGKYTAEEFAIAYEKAWDAGFTS